jgi:GNAT superfamily N-acetyltransferase
VDVSDLVIDDERITSNGARSVYYAALDELNRRYGGSDEEKHVALDELLPPKGLYLVARRDEHLVGGVGLRPISDPALNVAEVKRLWVRPDLRRHGVGIALMNEVEGRARKLGYERLYLESGYAQPEALELYRNSGWETVEEYPPGAFSYPVANRFTKLL